MIKYLYELEKDNLENFIRIISNKNYIKDKWVFIGY